MVASCLTSTSYECVLKVSLQTSARAADSITVKPARRCLTRASNCASLAPRGQESSGQLGLGLVFCLRKLLFGFFRDLDFRCADVFDLDRGSPLDIAVFAIKPNGTLLFQLVL